MFNKLLTSERYFFNYIFKLMWDHTWIFDKQRGFDAKQFSLCSKTCVFETCTHHSPGLREVCGDRT